VDDLRALLIDPAHLEGRGVATAKLAIMLRDIAWWDGKLRPFPAAAHQDYYLPDCAVIKQVGQTTLGKPVILTAKAGHNDGHHSHTDIGHFVLHVDGESLLCDPGRGLYSREYFREQRYENIFCNSISHNVPRIGGRLQSPGPEWNGHQQYHGVIVEHSEREDEKCVVIDFHTAYELPALTLARRTLQLMTKTGQTLLEDVFAFDGPPLDIEEAFLTWFPVETHGSTARILGKRSTLNIAVQEPAGAVFQATSLEADCRANKREGVLTRLTVNLPAGTLRFQLRITIGQ